MANKTLYIKDDDLHIWKAAETLSKGSLSSYITELLRQEVSRSKGVEEHDRDDLSEIRVHIDHDDDRRQVSFIGKWLVESITEDTGKNIKGTEYSVAITAKKRFFVFSEKLGAGEFHTYRVYNSFEEMKSSTDVPPGIVHSVARSLGREDMEHLDI